MNENTRWQDEWRHLIMQMKGWVDGQELRGTMSLVAQKAQRADEHDTLEFAYELQKAVERMDAAVKTYADRLLALRKDIGYLTAEIVKHRNLLNQHEREMAGRRDLLSDDEIVDRLAKFYNLPDRAKR